MSVETAIPGMQWQIFNQRTLLVRVWKQQVGTLFPLHVCMHDCVSLCISVLSVLSCVSWLSVRLSISVCLSECMDHVVKVNIGKERINVSFLAIFRSSIYFVNFYGSRFGFSHIIKILEEIQLRSPFYMERDILKLHHANFSTSFRM